MQKEFYLSNGKAMIDFTVKYCASSEQLLDSDGFKEVFESYLDKIKDKNSNIYFYLKNGIRYDDNKKILYNVLNILKLLLVLKSEDIINMEPKYEKILSDKDSFIAFVEDFYTYWRNLERYTIIRNNKVREGLQNVSFITANSRFSNLVLSTYRKIEENELGFKPKIYRQIPVGGNAGIVLDSCKWYCPKEYEALKDIPFIDSVVLNLPFITYPKKNKRDGVFQECFENPLKGKTFDKQDWLCYPAKIGGLLAFIYFHKDLMAHGVTLCNLFEIATEDEYRGKEPDIIFTFGVKDNDDNKTIFYDDKKNNIMVGYINYSEKIDYFGYMKKMILTLHNLIMIKNGNLPIHGAMVHIILKNGKTANVIIMGDSGAGKSESLEAFRELSEDYISDMKVVFDDMGDLRPNNGEKPLAYGTEIGAFVRLDDLDSGYAFREIDRSIFMNPDKINARLVIPVATYKDINKGYPVDFFLYANNYEEGGAELEFFDEADKNKAIDIFTTGARVAKGTTTEKGLVKTFFANPFGPVQRKEVVGKLIQEYFNDFYKNGVRVGQLRTRLGVKGKASEGPRKAAVKLFDAISGKF